MVEGDVGIHIKRICNQLERGKTRDLKDYDLTGTQFEVLEYLHCEDGKKCMLANIAAFFDVKHTSVLHVVKILEKKELVVREEKAPGRRAGRIFLTEKGQRLMEEMDIKKSRAEKIMLLGMTETDRQTLRELLQKVYRNLKQAESGGMADSLPTGEERQDERQNNGNI